MSREFFIGAIDLSPYYLRVERRYYVFGNVPVDTLMSLMNLVFADFYVPVFLTCWHSFNGVLRADYQWQSGVTVTATKYDEYALHYLYFLAPKLAKMPYWAWQRSIR